MSLKKRLLLTLGILVALSLAFFGSMSFVETAKDSRSYAVELTEIESIVKNYEKCTQRLSQPDYKASSHDKPSLEVGVDGVKFHCPKVYYQGDIVRR